MYFIDYSASLSHHGIKGMKWGVRRYQNEDGSLTKKGLERYRKDGDKYVKKSYYERQYSDLKSMGYSDKKAKELAKNRNRLRKVAIGTLAVAGTAAIAIAGYKYYYKNVDKTIKLGDALQTVHKEDIKDRLNGPFFATYRKKDNLIYSSSLFGHFREDSKITKLAANQNIKIASEGSARKVYKDLMKNDKDFAKYVRKRISNPLSLEGYRDFNYDLVKRGDVEDAMHKKFYDKLLEKGYSALTDSNDAYRETGGWTYDPIIVFGKPKINIAKQTLAGNQNSISWVKTTIFGQEIEKPDIPGSSAKSVKKLKTASAYSSIARAMKAPIASHAPLRYSAYTGATAASLLGIMGYQNRKSKKYIEEYRKNNSGTKKTNRQILSNKAIDEYRKQHPDTKLSNNEIVKLYYDWG